MKSIIFALVIFVAFITTMIVDFNMVKEEPLPWIIGSVVISIASGALIYHYIQEKRVK